MCDVREVIKAKGVWEGMEKGLEEGLKEEWRDGSEEERTEIALKMIEEQAELSFISKITGLPKTEIKELRKNF